MGDRLKLREGVDYREKVVDSEDFIEKVLCERDVVEYEVEKLRLFV